MLERNIYNPYRDGVTQSLLSTYRQCPTKARLYINGYTNTKTSRALTFGNLFHECVDMLYKNRTGFLYSELDFMFKALYNKLSEEGNTDEIRLVRKAEPQILYMIDQYINYYNNFDLGYNCIESESVFRVPIETSEGVVPIIGKRDRVFCKSDLTSVYLFETKTKGRYSLEGINESLKMDLQCNFYLISILKEYEVYPKGVIYDIIKTPDEKATVGDLTIDVPVRGGYWFQRLIKEWEPSDINQALVTLQEELGDFLRWWKKDFMKDYMYSHSCYGQYGSCYAIGYCNSRKQDVTMFEVRDTLFSELK